MMDLSARILSLHPNALFFPRPRPDIENAVHLVDRGDGNGPQINFWHKSLGVQPTAKDLAVAVI